MTKAFATPLPSRALLYIKGEDRVPFLQGLISNDVTKVSPTKSIWAAFLTPQGKYLHDFFLCEQDATFVLEGEAARLEDLKLRLSRYRLRAKVTLELAGPDWIVAAAWGEDLFAKLGLPEIPGSTAIFETGIAFVDPRLSAVGARIILPREGAQELLQANFTLASEQDYDSKRIACGLPDGSRDMEVEKAILLENGFDELGGADWQKGCYVGQELTARTKYRALIKKRLLPVRFEGTAPASGTAILQDGREVGEIRSVAGARALALLRLEALEKDAQLEAGGQVLEAEQPEWIDLQQAAPRPQPPKPQPSRS